MHVFMFVFVALLFFVLTPGIVLTIPPNCSKTTIAITHAVLFALMFTFTHKIVWDWGVENGWIMKHKKVQEKVNSVKPWGN